MSPLTSTLAYLPPKYPSIPARSSSSPFLASPRLSLSESHTMQQLATMIPPLQREPIRSIPRLPPLEPLTRSCTNPRVHAAQPSPHLAHTPRSPCRPQILEEEEDLGAATQVVSFRHDPRGSLSTFCGCDRWNPLEMTKVGRGVCVVPSPSLFPLAPLHRVMLSDQLQSV